MDHFKLTEREESYIVKMKSLNYQPNPMGLGYEFFYVMQRNKYSIAQIDLETGETESYGNLLKRCVRTSLKLILHDVTGDDVICICSSNHVDNCVPIISSLFLCIKVVPLDPDISIENTSCILSVMQPKYIFVSPDSVGYIEEALLKADPNIISELVVFGESEKYLEFSEFSKPVDDGGVEELKFKPLPLLSVDETAIILFDSNPSKTKGICLSHYALMIQAVNVILYCNFGQNLYLSNYTQEHLGGFMALLNYINHNWIFRILSINFTILAGMVRMVSSQTDATAGWRLIDKYNIPVVQCTKYSAVQLSRVKKPEGITAKSLKLLLVVADRFSKQELYELRKLVPNCFITSIFGLPEMCGPITMYSRNIPAHIRDQYENPTSCGKLIPGISSKIVDPITHKILGPNQPGELWCKSNFMVQHYHSLTVDNCNAGEWLNTNRLAYYDEKQRFYVLNRMDFMFKCETWHIVPTPIETVIKEHPAVEDAVVIGIPHPNPCAGQLPMGIVTLKKGMRNRVTADDIREYADSVLSRKQKLKAGLNIVKEIPFSLLGIPKRLHLREIIIQKMPLSELCQCLY